MGHFMQIHSLENKDEDFPHFYRFGFHFTEKYYYSTVCVCVSECVTPGMQILGSGSKLVVIPGQVSTNRRFCVDFRL